MINEHALTNDGEHSVIPVTDKDQAQHLLNLILDMVDPPNHIKPAWLLKNEWAAVPVESGGHFQEREAEWFSAAALSLGCYEGVAIATEPLSNTTLCYLVKMTFEGFMEINRACAGMNYILTSKDKAFSILLSTDDYFIVAGPKNFVVKAIGSSIPTARRMFLNFSNDLLWPTQTREQLLNVARRYVSFNGV